MFQKMSCNLLQQKTFLWKCPLSLTISLDSKHILPPNASNKSPTKTSVDKSSIFGSPLAHGLTPSPSAGITILPNPSGSSASRRFSSTLPIRTPLSMCKLSNSFTIAKLSHPRTVLSSLVVLSRTYTGLSRVLLTRRLVMLAAGLPHGRIVLSLFWIHHSTMIPSTLLL